MPTEPELLQAVLKNPDDDAPRLEYAKWCEAQGEPVWRERGELIRLQIQLRHARFDPLDAASWKPVDRAAALVARHGKRWAGFVGSRVEEFRFHRGFVAWVKTPAGPFLDVAQTIFETQPVQHVDLTDLGPAPERVLSSPVLGRLRSLALVGTGLDDRGLAVLAANPDVLRLRWLSLRNNRLSRAGIEEICRSRNLLSLEVVLLDGNPFDPREQYGADNDEITARWMPEEGRQLETMFGPLRWLHGAADTVSGWVPSRFG